MTPRGLYDFNKFLDLGGRPLGLLMSPATVSPVLHCLGLTRMSLFISLSALLQFAGEEGLGLVWLMHLVVLASGVVLSNDFVLPYIVLKTQVK